MSKRKKHQHRLSEINVVSSLDMATVVAEIASLENKQVHVVFDEIDVNHTGFTMFYQREGEATASVKGILRRWAGTMTHIICDGHARQKRPIPGQLHDYMKHVAMGWMILVLGLQFPRALFPNTEIFIQIFGALLFVGLFLVPAFFITRILAWLAGDGIHYIRDRERLLQGVVNVLASNDEETVAMQTQQNQSPLPLSEMVRLAYEFGSEMLENPDIETSQQTQAKRGEASAS